MIGNNTNYNNKIYIDCFFYAFYIEKNELIKYKNKNNEIIIDTLIDNKFKNNSLSKVNTINCFINYFNKLL